MNGLFNEVTFCVPFLMIPFKGDVFNVVSIFGLLFSNIDESITLTE